MKQKLKIILEIILVLIAISVLIYNFSIQKEIAYMASVVAVAGTIFILTRDIIKLKKK